MATDESNQKSHSEPANISEVGSEPQIATTEYKRYPVLSPNEWLLELITSFLALGLLIGIAIIFWYMDNKPLDAWTGRVSLNATISILTTACTTALMYGVSAFIAQSKWLHFRTGSRKLSDFETFDGASRGVWGSILLLTTVKWNLATIGAVITILRLAFSPFAQQVVLIEQRDVISPADTATFGYAHEYYRDLMSELANSGIDGIPQDPGMQSAIFRGLYGINTTEPFNCPGACQWRDSYISLGFKAECTNVTQETLQRASCERVENTSLQLCNMTTPGGIGLSSRQWSTSQATSYYMNASSLLLDIGIPRLPEEFPEITRFAIFRSTPNFNFEIENVNITDCSLSITAYEYTAAKANGSDFSFAPLREVDFGVRNPWAIRGNATEMKFEYLYTNATKTSDGADIPSLGFSYTSLLALQTFFQSSTIVSEWVEGDFPNTNLGVSAALLGDADLPARFNAMATAMTEYVRYGPNSLIARGERVESVPFVSIRWGYFVVPIVTEGFAIIFAVLSILNNRKSRNVPLWKGSTLAVLGCRHEGHLGLLPTSGRDLNEMQAEAQKAQARLQ
ncbi:hypothetical protein BJX64DRAFT_53600 [Aspergillus heterothallicus]